MRPKCGGKSGLWDIFFRLKENYAENIKKIGGAVWGLPVLPVCSFSLVPYAKKA